MDLEKLKKQLQKDLGIIDYDLSDSECIEIAQQIEKLSNKNKNESRLQSIVKSVTGIKEFFLLESTDNSDLNNLIDQIKNELKKHK